MGSVQKSATFYFPTVRNVSRPLVSEFHLRETDANEVIFQPKISLTMFLNLNFIHTGIGLISRTHFQETPV